MSIASTNQTGLTKVCGACGAAFTCCAPEACWCGAVKVERDTLKRLSVTYPDCLCPACLSDADKTSGAIHD
jgi:hypothetical protein